MADRIVTVGANPTKAAPAGEVVGTTDTQTLSNKTLGPTNTLTGCTLNSPALNAPEIWAMSSASHAYSGTTAWTVSETEKLAFVWYCLATATGAVDCIAAAPLDVMRLIINTSGQAVTVKASGQTGVAIANNKSAFVIGTGTDWKRVTADA